MLPIFGSHWGIKKRVLIESQVGTSVVQLLTFSNLDIIFYNTTWFLSLLFVIVFLLFPFLCNLVLCDVSIVPTNKKGRERREIKQENKGKHREAKKEINKEVTKTEKKKTKIKQGRHWANQQQCPVLRGKQFFVFLEDKTKRNEQKTNMEGLRVRWGGPKKNKTSQKHKLSFQNNKKKLSQNRAEWFIKKKKPEEERKIGQDQKEEIFEKGLAKNKGMREHEARKGEKRRRR